MGEEGPIAEQWEVRVFGLGILLGDHPRSITPWAEVWRKVWGSILQALDRDGIYYSGGLIFVGTRGGPARLRMASTMFTVMHPVHSECRFFLIHSHSFSLFSHFFSLSLACLPWVPVFAFGETGMTTHAG
jgi:hypothetical protein